MTNPLTKQDAVDARRLLLQSLESGEACAETVAEQLTLPGWHERPTCPGLWLVDLGRGVFDGRQVANDLRLDYLSEQDYPCYGPIPENQR